MLRIVIVGAVIWISVTAWFVPWDFLVTDWIVFLIAGVILAIFYNNLRGIGVVARSKWSMIWWRTELHDVGGDQGGRLLHSSCPRRKESTLWWRCSRKEEWPRDDDDGVLGRMSDFRIGGMMLLGRCSAGTCCRLPSGNSDGVGHVLLSWCGLESDN